MRTLLGCVAVLVLAFGADAAQPPKKDKTTDTKVEIVPAKLVGKWAPLGVKGKPEPKLAEEFTADGKYSFGGPMGLKGTYTVEGDALTITFEKSAAEGTGQVVKRKIKKVTDTEFVYVDGKATITTKKIK